VTLQGAGLEVVPAVEPGLAAAVSGQIADPRELPKLLDIDYPQLEVPRESSVNVAMLEPPLPGDEAQQVELVKSENISSLPDFDDPERGVYAVRPPAFRPPGGHAAGRRLGPVAPRSGHRALDVTAGQGSAGGVPVRS
jgi:hypothetical protein